MSGRIFASDGVKSRGNHLLMAIVLGLIAAALAVLPFRGQAADVPVLALELGVEDEIRVETEPVPDVERIASPQAPAAATWPRRFVAVAGATVDSATPDVNLVGDASRDYTQIGEKIAGDHVETWMDFDLAAIPVSATIQAARLRVYVYPGSAVPWANTFALPAQGAWEEETLTWNSRPSLSGPGINAMPPSSSTRLTFDLTELVQAWVIGGTPEYGLALQSVGADGDWLGFLYSRHSEYPPELVVTYTLSANGSIFAGLVQEVGFGPPEEHPMEGIPMRLYGSSIAGELGDLIDEALTDDQGEYALHYVDTGDVLPITYTLVMSDEAYWVISAFPVDGNTPELSPEGHLVFGAGTESGLFESFFHIEPRHIPPTVTLVFEGNVSYPGGGEPAEGVEVVVYRTVNNIDEPLQVMAGASTGLDGSFRLPLLEPYDPYTYVVQVADAAYQVLLVETSSGSWTTEDQRVVFTDPPIPGTYGSITFTVEPDASYRAAASRSALAEAATTDYRPVVAVLLTPQCTCGFTECTNITNANVLNAFGQTLFNTSGDSIRNFFLEMSQDAYSIQQAGLFQVVPMDDPSTASQNESNNCPKPGWTTEEHRAYVAQRVLGQQLNFNFGNFDDDGDGTVREDELIVLLAATDPNPGNARMRVSDPRSVRVGNVNVRVHYVMVMPGTDFSTIAHELAHATVFPGTTNIPGDLYGGAGNAGTYSLMDNHCHGRPGPQNPNVPYTPTQHIFSRRPHLDPWNKSELGWVTPTVVTADTWAYFDAVEDDGVVYRLQSASNPNEYFLIENRWPAGSEYETALPDSGLAIWHINESLLPAQHQAIMLERAGGGVNSGAATQFCNDDNDNTALWDGTEGFHSSSSPSSDWASGANSNLAVLCISAPGPSMEAYLSTNWTQVLPLDGDEPNNSQSSATPILPGTYLTRTLHAPCDTDGFVMPHWKDVVITVTVQAFTNAGHTVPAPPLQINLVDDNYYTSPSFSGTGVVTGHFQFQGEVYIEVTGASQAVYYEMTISTSQGGIIPPDRYDVGSRNDSIVTSADITETIVADRLLAPGLIVYDLNLDSNGDQDYFTLQLPPATNPSSGQAECLSAGDPLLSSPDVTQGALTISISAQFKRAMTIRLYDSSHTEITSQATINGLQARLECPHDHLQSDGEIIVYVDETRVNFYSLNVYYHRWYQYKEFPEWLLLTDPPMFREVPAIWGRFPWIYPATPWIQDDLLNGVAEFPLPIEYVPFRWQSSLPLALDVRMQQDQQLNVFLWNSNREVIAEVNLPGPMARTDGITLMGQLYAPEMSPGWYALGFDNALELTEFELWFHHWPVYLPVVMR